MLKQIAVLVLSIAVLTMFVGAEPLAPDQSSTNFKDSATIGAAGGLSSTNFRIDALAYDVSGYTSGNTLSTCLGAWCPAIAPIGTAQIYTLKFSGTVTYSNGTVVSNSDIEVGVTDLKTTQFYLKTARTDGSGGFSAQVEKVPQTVLDDGYSVSIRLISSVQAAYQKICNYDSGTNRWLC